TAPRGCAEFSSSDHRTRGISRTPWRRTHDHAFEWHRERRGSSRRESARCGEWHLRIAGTPPLSRTEDCVCRLREMKKALAAPCCFRNSPGTKALRLCKRPPSPWPSLPGEGINLARSQFFDRRVDQSSAWFTEETGDDSPSPGG